jgi:Sulfotransferase domain
MQILTIRDSPAAWFKSTYETVGSPESHDALCSEAVTSNERMRHMGDMLSMLAWDNPDTFAGRMHAGDAAFCEAVYTRWNDDVKVAIDAGRLLVFNVKEGWGPLCEFLGVEVPDEPFPHMWDTSTYHKAMTTIAAYAADPSSLPTEIEKQ